MHQLIAIIDDDEPVRQALRRMLASHGLAAEVFESAEAFLRSDLLRQVSCLIADIRMPGLSGLALHIRLASAGYRIPTILITGCSTEGERQHALAVGVIEYLTKPFSEEALLESLHKALASHDAAKIEPAGAVCGKGAAPNRD